MILLIAALIITSGNPQTYTFTTAKKRAAEVHETRQITFYCGCMYYQRVFRDGDIDPQIGVYRAADDGPCGQSGLVARV